MSRPASALPASRRPSREAAPRARDLPALRALRTGWARLAPRERMLVSAAATMLGLALFWWIALAPALQTLRGADARHRALDAQEQRMLDLRAQAQALQSQPRIPTDQARRALEAGVAQQFGAAAQVGVLGERATVTLRGVSAQALAEWLAQARTTAHALPVESHLTRSAARAAPAASAVPAVPAALPPGAIPGIVPSGSATAPLAAGPDARWDGSVVLQLPATR
jgi:general secretion pathway protein M